MISRIPVIKVEVGVTETLIILDITKLNLIIVLSYIERNKKKNSCLCFFTDGKQNKVSEFELDMITLRNHAPRSYTT